MLSKTPSFALMLLLAALAPSASGSIAVKLRSVESDVFSAGERLMFASMIRNDLRARQSVANRRDAAKWTGIKSLEEWRRFSAPRIDALRRSLGTLGRTLKPEAHVTRVLEGPGYRIENLVYKGRADSLVTANLYLPSPARSKLPVIILVHSHHNPKTQGELQDMGMTWARNGCAVLVIDQMGFGERRQHPAGPRQDYRFRYIQGIKLHLVGESLMGWMVWDLMRAVDLVFSRPEVDRRKIILMGSVAGGGDVAAVTAALDDRIACVIPFNFGGPEPETMYPLPDDAESTFNYMGSGSWESTRCLRLSGRDGFLPWSIVASVAPRCLVYAHEFSWDRARDPVWKRFEKLFALHGAADRLSFAHGYGLLSGKPPEASHCNNVGEVHRKQIHAALERWFGIPVPQEYEERRSEDELRCLTTEVLEKLKPRPIDRTIAAIGASRVAAARRALEGSKPGERRERLRQAWRRLLGDIEPPAAPGVRSRTATDIGQGVKFERVLLEVESGIGVPILLMLPARARAPVVVGLCQDGKRKFLVEHADSLAQLLERGVAVCLPDLRGTGETRPEGTRQYQSEATAISAGELMLGQTLLGLRLRDLRSVLRYLVERKDIDAGNAAFWGESFAPTNPKGFADPLIGEGAEAQQSEPLGGLLAILGALYEDGVRAVAARGMIAGYQSILRDLFCYVPHDAVIPGALAAGDIPDLAAALAPRSLRLEALVDGRNCAVAPNEARDIFVPTLRAYRGSKDRFQLSAFAGNDVANWLADALTPASTKASPSEEGWKLAWADEFNEGGKPSTRNWTYEAGFVRNQELQWYQPDNAWCEKGFLVLEARKERTPNPNYDPNGRDWKTKREYAEYTSASMTTRGVHAWRYGRFEMRGRIDTRPGLWPAFWTLGVEGRWPSNGEIDVMEYYRGMLLANAAWGTDKPWVAAWDDIRKPITEFGDPDWSRKFHIWRMDWDEQIIRLYVDDLLLNTIELEKTVNKDKEEKNPFHQPHYILLNLAIGGTSGGDPSQTAFPARFEVDYVRIYQKDSQTKGNGL